jgi:transcriptional regulator GlxA family with amidase domain
MPAPQPPTRVAILAMPETTASVVYGMYDLFMSAGRDWGAIVEGRPGPQVMEPSVVSSHTGSFTAANGVPMVPQGTLAGEGFDVVCVPELAVPPGEPLDGRFVAEIDWIRRCYAGGAAVATACSGALLLAEAGLLDGEEATTHWAYGDVLRRRHPRVKLRLQAALVSAGEAQRLIMAGGGTSWLDLGLYLIARYAGVETAMQVARVNLIDWHDVGQQPFARLARTRQSDDAVVGRCQEWIAAHYRERAPVARMLEASGLPERTFKRRFRQATGLAPLEYVHTLRLEDAKQRLERSDSPVEAIAEEVGYEDAGFFGRLFRRQVGLTPAQYRRRFGGLHRALTSGHHGRRHGHPAAR